MAHNNIEDMLDYLRRIKSGDAPDSNIDLLEIILRFLRTIIRYPRVLLPDSFVKITKLIQFIREGLQGVFKGNTYENETKLNGERLVSQLLECIEGNYTSFRCNYELDDSYLLEYMDCADTNLNALLMSLKQFCGSDIERYLKKVKIIQKKMRFMRYLYDMEINGYVDHEKLQGLETRIQFMAENVTQYCLDLWSGLCDCVMLKDVDVDMDDIRRRIPYLLYLNVLVKLEMKKIFLGELNGSKFGQSRTFKKQKIPKGFSRHLHLILEYVRKNKLENFPDKDSARNIEVTMELLDVLVDVPNHVINGDILEKIGTLAADVLCVHKKLLANSIIKDDISKINLCSVQMLENAENLKAQVERYYSSFNFTPSKFPTVGGLSFLDSLLRKLNEMLKSESALDLVMKPQVGILERELSFLTSVFRDVMKVQHEHEVLKDLQKRTINLAYEAEIAVDSVLARYNSFQHFFCSLPAILKEMKQISVEVSEMWSENLALKPCSLVNPSKHLPTQHGNPMNDNEEVVGFEDNIQGMMQHLIQRKDELDVLPIVGMAGKGKTTFARRLYNDRMIVSHFDSRAWCCVTQSYNRRDLLQEIFSQVSDPKDKTEKVDEVADKLRKVLIGKRYLIVMDDMWDVMAWDDLKLSFPNGENGSRIVVTTRLEKVGEHVKQRTDPYFLPFLTSEESLRLLQRKVFQEEDCPLELQDVSRDVAERCSGLPLVVVLIAGIIKKKKMEESWWHEIKDALFTYLGESEEYSHPTMQLSYDNLPDYLKPCLLYMGMFEEDAIIEVSKLISLWIAEGFVHNIEPGRSEEAAEGYLMDLITSNVVMVSKRRYDGKVKYCQVHDVVHHFCLEKSREEKFILVVEKNFQPLDWKATRVRVDVFYDQLDRFRFPQKLRSLIRAREVASGGWDLSPLSKLRLLKVLDLSSHWVLKTFSSATLRPLIHLKYLSVRAKEFDFHPNLHLCYLETLIVKCEDVVVPEIFWKMRKLRHVRIDGAVFSFENKHLIFEESSILGNLRILRGIKFPVGDVDSMEVLLRRCPNLQDVNISIYCDEDSEEICTCSLKLESLTQLQSLHLSFDGGNIIVSELYFPSSLKKLVLEGPHKVNLASMIDVLPSLEYLQLVDNDWGSKEWCLGDITFGKLKILKLVSCGISRWDASEESFPQLERLVIKWCDELEEIPLSFADIQTLKQIMLIGGKKESLDASAVKIKVEVEEIEGCDRVDLIVKDLYS